LAGDGRQISCDLLHNRPRIESALIVRYCGKSVQPRRSYQACVSQVADRIAGLLGGAFRTNLIDRPTVIFVSIIRPVQVE